MFYNVFSPNSSPCRHEKDPTDVNYARRSMPRLRTSVVVPVDRFEDGFFDDFKGGGIDNLTSNCSEWLNAFSSSCYMCSKRETRTYYVIILHLKKIRFR